MKTGSTVSRRVGWGWSRVSTRRGAKRRRREPAVAAAVERLEDRTLLSHAPLPTVVDPNLAVREVVDGLVTPTSMAFLGEQEDGFFILEKQTGQVKLVTPGDPPAVTTVLDLAVNNASERGLLGIALHPDFPSNPSVYLYWTESTTGTDSGNLDDTPLLGNRVDRFVWDGSSLTQRENIIRLRALQPPNPPAETRAFGNHDGGVLRFGPDGKLYVLIGDVGRRGQTQNLEDGPFPPGDPRFGTDDQFGGPQPDDAHLTGVILRLNDDGSAPTDNPFADIGHVFAATLTGDQEVPANSSMARGFATFFLDQDMTALSFTVTVAGLDFTGSQTSDPGDDLLAAHIHAPASRGQNAGVVFGFFGTPFNDTDPNDVVVTPFADGAGGTITSKWDLNEGNNTTLAEQIPNILAGNSYINFHTRDFPGGEIRGQIEENPQVTENVHKIFSYGHRNSFGIAFDPKSGNLWNEENGDDSFTELNLVEPGMNGGWIQIAGPVERIDQFKAIETGQVQERFRGLQQERWSPDNIADSPEEALSRLFMLPGAEYSDPEFAWKFEVPPAGIGFLDSRALGPQYEGDLFVGAARPFLEGGFLFHFNLTGNRRKIAVDDPRLEDRVADNNPTPTGPTKGDLTESESLLFGRNFGVGTDIQTGPNGNLFVVSLSNGAVYEIFRDRPGKGPKEGKDKGPKEGKDKGPKEGKAAVAPSSRSQVESRHFVAPLSGDEEVPARETRARGLANFQLSKDGTELHYRLNVANIENVVASHIHIGPAGENGPVVVFLFGDAPPGGGRFSGVLAEGTITEGDLIARPAIGFGGTMAELLDAMRSGNAYVNVHTNDGIPPINTGPGDFPGGEIRGQIFVAGPNGGRGGGGAAATFVLSAAAGASGSALGASTIAQDPVLLTPLASISLPGPQFSSSDDDDPALDETGGSPSFPDGILPPNAAVLYSVLDELLAVV